MPESFVSETLKPLDASFDARAMARGEPGLPRAFRWRKKDWQVAEVLEQWKEHGACTHGSGERYLRKHGYRVRTTDGTIFRIYFQRHLGKARFQTSARWWIYSMENPVQPSTADLSPSR